MPFGTKKDSKRFTRIFYASDIHASELCFRKFVNAGEVYKANVLILGGDVTGKMIVPIVDKGDGTSRCNFLRQDFDLTTKEAVQEMERKISNSGLYPYHTDSEEMEEIKSKPEKVDEVFKKLVTERITNWVRFAEEKLRGTGVKCFMTGGNDDFFFVEDIINSSDFIINPEGKVVQVDEHHEMIGSGYANMTPWKCPRDVPDEELAKKIEAVISKVQNVENCIFCFHAPPIDSQLDTAPRVDASEYPPKVVMSSGGQALLFGAGSTAVREAIEKYQPFMGLHGHIHESRGLIHIGRTVCVNPGSEYSEGILRGVIMNINENKLLSYQFTSG